MKRRVRERVVGMEEEEEDIWAVAEDGRTGRGRDRRRSSCRHLFGFGRSRGIEWGVAGGGAPDAASGWKSGTEAGGGMDYLASGRCWRMTCTGL